MLNLITHSHALVLSVLSTPAQGSDIQRLVTEKIDKPWSRGSVYTTLHRMQRVGLIKRKAACYTPTPKGKKALEAYRKWAPQV